jgi:hypothetical protein
MFGSGKRQHGSLQYVSSEHMAILKQACWFWLKLIVQQFED